MSSFKDFISLCASYKAHLHLLQRAAIKTQGVFKKFLKKKKSLVMNTHLATKNNCSI